MKFKDIILKNEWRMLKSRINQPPLNEDNYYFKEEDVKGQDYIIVDSMDDGITPKIRFYGKLNDKNLKSLFVKKDFSSNKEAMDYVDKMLLKFNELKAFI